MGEIADKALRVQLPATAGVSAKTRTAISTSAANIDMSACVGNFVRMQAVGADAYFSMTTSASDTTVTSTAGADQGWKILDGQYYEGWVQPGYKFCKVIGSASGSLLWYDSSEQPNT